MRMKAYRKMLRVVPCMRRKFMRTDSWKDIEEILKSKLATIKEEPETCEESLTPPRMWCLAKSDQKKIGTNSSKDMIARHFLIPNFSLKGSYLIFMTGLSSKRGRLL